MRFSFGYLRTHDNSIHRNALVHTCRPFIFVSRHLICEWVSQSHSRRVNKREKKKNIVFDFSRFSRIPTNWTVVSVCNNKYKFSGNEEPKKNIQIYATNTSLSATQTHTMNEEANGNENCLPCKLCFADVCECDSNRNLCHRFARNRIYFGNA